ncbi:Isochorismatase hydrolase [Fusarium albosuccineum]|uniref:Isochorismatase hydrolase n=1 Tax=Fusarium albosuccineum TaxID=1237068 RepID=A0A8H4LMT4_9HYPO|nr:Isochorismatase hydrolase [Fusarium albosuccineum]
MAIVHEQSPLSLGRNFAILNLDLMTILIDAVKDTPEAQSFISNCIRWNDAVHNKDPRPLTLFTSLYFSNDSQPELAGVHAPFTKLVKGFHPCVKGSPAVEIDSRFAVDDKDTLLQKTRWYAGMGNALEQILKAQNIDTVVISGLSLSGVVMSTVYRLFDLDYTIYVISDNVLELPVQHHIEFARVMLDSLLNKMNIRVISIEEALQALEQS